MSDDRQGNLELAPRQKETWLDISPEAQAELKSDNAKRTLPTFDQDQPDNLKHFLSQIEQYAKCKGWKLGETKIMEAIYHMTPETQKYLIEPMESAKGEDWEQFKKDLLDEFPEVHDDDIGSVTRNCYNLAKLWYPTQKLLKDILEDWNHGSKRVLKIVYGTSCLKKKSGTSLRVDGRTPLP
ncbi:hypothetical protein L218DRAFT_944326 [Marasmius fiardii PR-910]|nr:hypothetical protein L218DRAFT_944326 [Marasmius fiardii PR-910]